MRRLCAISVDVDPMRCYYGIHGLGPAPAELRDLIARRCLPRFAKLFASRGILATFFIVGEDLDVGVHGGSARAAYKFFSDLARNGHELGNHSYSHPYDLARLDAARVRNEVERAHDLISQAAGAGVRGFRAPGYDLSPTILEELCRLGYQYDSSLLPAPGYYAAKAAVMAAMAAMGEGTEAVMTDPRGLLAPLHPYRPSLRAPWRRGDATLLEIPLAVTPLLRTPAIGTSLLLAPAWLRRRWLRSMRRRALFNFELHAIDLADAEEDGLPGALVARQPDLRVPLQHKLAALEEILAELSRVFEFSTLGRAAARALGALMEPAQSSRWLRL
jgi:hypothetical protein